jgi:serine/threonine-protein kinase RsbT
MSGETHVRVRSEHDILTARQRGRELAEQGGFSTTDLTLIATAISEVARNIVEYAGNGEIALSLLSNGDRRGLVVVASDLGPGIPDIPQAMQDGYSTGRSLGLGLPGARRLMDEFEIVSEVGKGTTVTMRKWIRLPSARLS